MREVARSMIHSTPARRPATLDALPADVRHAVRAALKPDEQVLWAGKPVSGAAWADMMPAVISSRWARVLLFAIGALVTLYVLLVFVVLGGAAMWEWATREDFGWAQLPVFLFFVVLLLWLVAQLVIRLVFPLVSIALARRSAYVLTSRRALIARKAPDGIRLQNFELGTVEDPSLHRVRKDGVGDIIFDGQAVLEPAVDGSAEQHVIFETGFTACPEAQHVITLMKQARARRREVYETERIDALRYDHSAQRPTPQEAAPPAPRP